MALMQVPPVISAIRITVMGGLFPCCRSLHGAFIPFRMFDTYRTFNGRICLESIPTADWLSTKNRRGSTG
jgi:hypothetical protein